MLEFLELPLPFLLAWRRLNNTSHRAQGGFCSILLFVKVLEN